MTADEPTPTDPPEPSGSGSTGSDSGGPGAFNDADGIEELRAGKHLGWRISALLDGELPVTDEIVAREHLADCDLCQQEFAEVMAARAFVRGLGDVEPPTGYFDRLAAHTRRRMPTHLGMAGLVAIAAVWICLLIIGAGLSLPDVVPPVDDFVEQHEQAMSDDPADVDADHIELASGDAVGPPFVLPDELASGFQRVAAYDHGDGVVQVLYRQGDTEVSLFEQEGTLAWSSLPDYGEERRLGGQRAWVGTLDGSRSAPGQVVVIPDGPVVYTLVTTGEADPALALAPELPEPQDYSWSDRARRNVETIAERIGL